MEVLKTPEVEFGMGIPNSTYDVALSSAKSIENAGFAMGGVSDFITDGKNMDCLTTIAAIAPQTQRIKFLTVLGVNRRHPVVLAQMAATVDQISKGRLRLGIGIGGVRQDRIAGIPHEHSVTRLRETIEIVRKLWTEEGVRYSGRLYKLDGVSQPVRPHQKTIPIWIAAQSPLSQKVAGELADVWISDWLYSPQLFKEKLGIIHEHAKRVGRDPESVGACFRTNIYIDRDQSVAEEKGIRQTREFNFGFIREPVGYDFMMRSLNELGFRKKKEDLERPEDIPRDIAMEIAIIGDPDHVIKRIEEYIQSGAKYFRISYINPDGVELLTNEVLPHFRDTRK